MVEVFSTNVPSEEKANILLKRLQEIFPTYRINFDLEDCDNILRVEISKEQMDINRIIKIVNDFGFSAEVLSDIPHVRSHLQ